MPGLPVVVRNQDRGLQRLGASGAGGWVARAAAAASAVGSGPLIRVVFRVATSGKPSSPDRGLLGVVGRHRDRHHARLRRCRRPRTG